MMITEITEGTYQLSVNVENILFEGLWEIPNGVTLNSYIIKGEKTAIIDGVADWDGLPESLFAILDQMEIKPESIEYLIINHIEPDHSGWIQNFKKITNDFKVVCSKKAADMLESFYGHTENVIVVGDGDSLDLGKGHILDFYEIPNVHWPDTIATFDTSTEILFPCDAFGSFGTITENKCFDDQLTDEEIDFYEKEAVRYYANIVATFSASVTKAIDKCSTLPIKVIAPGHGIMWRKDPSKIVDDYSRYASYQKGDAKKEITFVWGSMYGMTEKAVKYILDILEKEDVKVHVHRVPEESWGTILTSAWTSKGIIIAAPTYEYKMFPPASTAIEEMGKKKVNNRKALYLGSFGWSGGAKREVEEINERLKMNWEFIDFIEFKGSPKEEDLKLIEKQVKVLVNSVLE